MQHDSVDAEHTNIRNQYCSTLAMPSSQLCIDFVEYVQAEALQATLAKLNKRFGANTVMKFSDRSSSIPEMCAPLPFASSQLAHQSARCCQWQVACEHASRQLTCKYNCQPQKPIILPAGQLIRLSQIMQRKLLVLCCHPHSYTSSQAILHTASVCAGSATALAS